MLVSILSRSTVVAFGWTESGFARSIIDGTPRTRRCTCRTGNPHVFFAPLAHGQAHIFAPPLASSPRPPGVEAAPLTETVFSAVVDNNAQSPVAWAKDAAGLIKSVNMGVISRSIRYVLTVEYLLRQLDFNSNQNPWLISNNVWRICCRHSVESCGQGSACA